MAGGWQTGCERCGDTDNLIRVQVAAAPPNSNPPKGYVMELCAPKKGDPTDCLTNIIIENKGSGYRFEVVRGANIGGETWSPSGWTQPGLGDPSKF